MPDGLRVARHHDLTLSGDSVRVVVTAAGGGSPALSTIATVGGRIEAEYAGVVQAYVPVGALRRLADLAAISYVGVPAIPIPDATIDEGVIAANASTWQAGGVNGAGRESPAVRGTGNLFRGSPRAR